MSNLHKGHRGRVRDRVRKEGLDNFQDYQVLEYALMFPIPYKDTNELAHRLINKFGSFAGVLEADEDDLIQVDGMGEVAAHFLSNLKNIFHYYQKESVDKKSSVSTPRETYNFCKKLFVGKLVEQLYLVCVNPKGQVECVEKIAEGNTTEANVNIRLIVDKMNRAKVSSIIIAHNHPKGRPEPSNADDTLTKALVTNLSINGCHLLEHLIIGQPDDIEIDKNGKLSETNLIENNCFYSYRKSGKLDEYKSAAADFVGLNKVMQPCAKYEVDDD